MASEYIKWQVKDEKPKEEAPPLQGSAKVKNWLYYHKVHLLAGAAAAWIVWEITAGTLGIGKTFPDYQIAYVGTYPLPAQTQTALEEAFAACGADLNGDGQVIASLHQYIKNTEGGEAARENASYNTATEAALMADMEDCESYFFLLEDPAGFERDYQILAHPDGTLPAEGEKDGLYAIAWEDAPGLAAMDLGTYEEQAAGQTIKGSGNDLVRPLFLARRGFWTDKTVKHKEGCDALWEVLTKGS